jgi:glyoxylase I family protein
MEVIGIDHPAIAADNVEALADWYVEVLEFSKWFKHCGPAENFVIWMLKAPDNTLLEIMPKDESDRPVRTVLTAGWSHLALRVQNLESAIAFLDSKNITWMAEATQAIGGGQVRSFYDLEGNMVQIVERIPIMPL